MPKLLALLLLSTYLLSCDGKGESVREKQPEEEPLTELNEDTVSMRVVPAEISFDALPERLEVTLHNNTPDTILTGVAYTIEFYVHGEWKVVSPDVPFDGIGYEMWPSSYHIFNKPLFIDQLNYEKGEYRIVKEYLKNDYRESEKTYLAYGTFRIE